jgi:potassium-transporting ATPase KdpC subunit
MIHQALQALRVFLGLSAVVGVFYPIAVTLIGQSLWSYKANGSIVVSQQQIVGSELLAQKTESPSLFWPRPSSTDYGTLPSGASNLGPTSSTLKALIEERKSRGLVAEMQFASASGLDPHISYEAAKSQLIRVAQVRNLNLSEQQELLEMVKGSIEKRDLGFLGEERINVLRLNMRLIERFGR